LQDGSLSGVLYDGCILSGTYVTLIRWASSPDGFVMCGPRFGILLGAAGGAVWAFFANQAQCTSCTPNEVPILIGCLFGGLAAGNSR
jgi:hypothetical protein